MNTRDLANSGVPAGAFRPRTSDAPYQVWGANLEPDALQQMKNACKLPVAVSGALMPDAHVGYGLPIGGVLATSNAVIPYAVGVDIACRMKMTILDLPPSTLTDGSAAPDESARTRNSLWRRCHVQVATAARRHGQGLAGHGDDRQAEGQGMGAARHERQRQSLRRVRHADRARRCGRARSRNLPRAAQPLGQPGHWRAGGAAL